MNNITYNEVPNILTGKDIDYLSDMFNWNYLALKKTNESKTKVQDEEIINILNKSYNIFKNNLNIILSILNEGGSNEQQ